MKIPYRSDLTKIRLAENLVKNGIDAMRGQGSISVEIMATHKKALVHISDTGKGLAKKDFKKIGKPINRAGTQTKFGCRAQKSSKMG